MPLKEYGDIEKLNLFWKVSSYTMVGYGGLSNIYNLSQFVEKNKVEGAFVECGVWRGGCSAVMAYVAQKAKSNRKMWLFDSFEGLPEPTAKDGNRAQKYASNRVTGKLSTIGMCVSPLEILERLFFSELNINRKNVIIEKGWFQDTLPKAKERIGHIAILRLDGDWYESTKCCLNNLYDNVVSGGFIIIDDYRRWEGCRLAVDEFLRKRDLNPNLLKIDSNSMTYFQKL